MANTLNLGDGNWGVKDSSLLGYAKDNTKFVPETFDVTRASSGTRVNKDGLIETPTEIGSELITNGDFSDGSTDWTINDWNISGGLLNGSNSTGIVFQDNLGTVIGKTYKVVLDISNYTSGDIRFKLGGSAYQNIASENGMQEFYFLAGSSADNILFTVQNAFTGSIDNVSVVEINQDNLARIDYSDGADGVLLTEPQSTNLIKYSENFNSGVWSVASGITVTENTTDVLSPSGLYNANKIVSTDATRGFFYPTLSVTSDATRTIYLKGSVGGETVLIKDSSGFGGSTAHTLTTDWARYEHKTVNDGNTYQGLFVDDISVGTIYAWGAQIEELPYPTSYIPTYGAIASRSGDEVNNGGSVTNFNSEEGVLFVEASSLSQTPTTDGIIRIENSLDSSNEYVDLRYDTSQNRVQIVVRVGGVNQTTSGVVISDTTDNNKFALKYKENDIALWVNGVEEITVSSASVPSGLNELLFSGFYGKTKNIQVFNEALSDAELQTLTTI